MQKTILAALIMLLVIFQASGQKKGQSAPPAPPQLPMDAITNKITYEEVVDVPGKSAAVLYQKILAWFQGYYKNPGEVIRQNDTANFEIVGKPRFRISNPPDKEGMKTDAGIVQYTITVAAKDGRFKYTLTDFNQKAISYYACERWYDTAAPSYSPAMSEYLLQTDNYAKSTIADLVNSITIEKPVKNKDDW